MRIKKSYLVLSIFVSVFAVFVISPKARAATFVVNNTGDASDATPGDGTCATAGAVCTFRAAIEETNALAGDDTINFAIAGSGPHTISPGAPFDNITGEVIIDATTAEATTSCGTLMPTIPGTNTPHSLHIIIDGSSVTDGLVVEAPNILLNDVSIQGLNLQNFSGSAIVLTETGISGELEGTTITCNYIGTNIAGSSAASNGTGIVVDNTDVFETNITNNLISGNFAGMDISNPYHFPGNDISDNIIGLDSAGTSAIGNEYGMSIQNSSFNVVENNVVSGNEEDGITAYSTDSGSWYFGNYVGFGIDGGAIGNGGAGISISGSSYNIVGNATSGNRNYISANGGHGVEIINDCEETLYAYSNRVNSNYIGTNLAGDIETGYGNSGDGVFLAEWATCSPGDSVTSNKIGDLGVGNGNIIAGNGGNGVTLSQGVDANVSLNSIISNRIFGNAGYGIDIATDEDDDGVPDTDLGSNPNDVDDTDGGTNHYMNYPIINDATFDGNDITINFDLDVNPSDTSYPGWRLEFFLSNPTSGNVQGEYLVHSMYVDGDETSFEKTFTSPVTPGPGMHLTATATAIDEYIEPEITMMDSIKNQLFPVAFAAEISEPFSPDGTVLLYSTSEFSPAFTFPAPGDPESASGGSSDLADTGMPLPLLLIAVLSLVATAYISRRFVRNFPS